MANLHVALFLFCAAWGVFGAFWTARLFWGLSYPAWLYHPIGVFIYVGIWLTAFFLHLYKMPQAVDQATAFMVVGKVFFLGLPFGIYMGTVVFRLGASFFAFSGANDYAGMPNHMDADAAMASRRYDHAIACYQGTLKKWPDDLGTILRLSRAYEAAGKLADAQSLLETHRNECMPAELGGPPHGNFVAFTKDTQDRLAALTVALSGIYSDVFFNKPQARKVCEEILPYLNANTASQPVKDRLAKLN